MYKVLYIRHALSFNLPLSTIIIDILSLVNTNIDNNIEHSMTNSILVYGILALINNKNFIAVEYGDVHASQYHIFRKTYKVINPKNYPPCTRRAEKDKTKIYHTSIENLWAQRNLEMKFWNSKIPSELECQTKNGTYAIKILFVDSTPLG